MWSDNDIDKAFQRLNPPEPEPTPFPLDAWLRLETQLDQAVIARAVRHKLWQFFAAEVAVVALLALGWWLWPARPAAGPASVAAAQPAAAPRAAGAVTQPGAIGAAATTPVPASGTAAEPRTSAGPVSAPAVASAIPVGPEAAGGPGTPTRADRPTRTFAPTSPAVIAIASSRRDSRNAATETGAFFGDAGQGATANHTGMSRGPARARLALAAGERTWAPRQRVDNGGTGTVGAVPSGAYGSGSNQPPSSSSATATVAAASYASNGTADSASEKGTGAGSAAQDALDGLAAQAVALDRPVAPALPAPLASGAAVTPPAAEPGCLPRFYLGLVAAPDVSTVKFAGVQSPLPNVGLTLEYRLTARLRLTTGLLRSTKQYEARREDYDWGAYKSRVYQRDFQTVDATCTVLDVPLNLRYDLVSEARHRVFASAGLSSFFMQRERYYYDYLENNMPREWSLEVVNGNRNVGSILNLSAGYERRLGGRWSAQAEPYLKLPLAGVGAGNVRLTSAGVFFGLKYGL